MIRSWRENAGNMQNRNHKLLTRWIRQEYKPSPISFLHYWNLSVFLIDPLKNRVFYEDGHNCWIAKRIAALKNKNIILLYIITYT
jgi:hypothetical protein